MYVIAHHRIVDPARFRALAAAPVVDRPRHWRLISAAPTRDGGSCFSLWWADSASALEPVLARAAGGAGSVVCYDVDEDDALGLDRKPIVVVRLSAPWGVADGEPDLDTPRTTSHVRRRVHPFTLRGRSGGSHER